MAAKRWTDASDGIATDDYSAFDGINYDDGSFSTTSLNIDGDNDIPIANLNIIVKGG